MLSYPTISQQPIARAELSHQKHSDPHRHQRGRWAVRTVIILTYLTAIISLGSEIALALAIRLDFERSLSVGLSQLLDSLGVFPFIPVILIMALHYRLMLRTLSLSADSLSRERHSNTWDTLILTGINARQIVRGKWSATVRHMWQPYLRLGLLRALIIGWFGASFNRGYVLSSAHFLYGGSGANMVVPTLAHFVYSAVFVVVLTLANLALTAACGLTAFHERGSVAQGRAVVTRLCIGIGIAILASFAAPVMFHITAKPVDQNIVMLVLYTLSDNGVALGGEVVSYHFYNSYYTDTSPIWLPVLLITLAAYALLTYILLRFAQWQAVRNNALPPLPSARSKPI